MPARLEEADELRRKALGGWPPSQDDKQLYRLFSGTASGIRPNIAAKAAGAAAQARPSPIAIALFERTVTAVEADFAVPVDAVRS